MVSAVQIATADSAETISRVVHRAGSVRHGLPIAGTEGPGI